MPPPRDAAPGGRHHHTQADQAPRADPRRPDHPPEQGDHLRQRAASRAGVHLRDHCHVRRDEAGTAGAARRGPRHLRDRPLPRLRAARHVVEKAEYVPGLPVRLAIDCGLSRHVGALFFQVRERDGATPGSVRRIISVFADYYAVDKTSSDNARAILDRSYPVCGGRIDRVYLDPASTARSGIGPAARGEFARVLGERVTDCWPVHRVLEGLDQVEILLGAPPREPDLWIHPRCKFLIESFKTYRRAESKGEILDAPADPQHPAEEAMDALRGAVRTVFPEGRMEPTAGMRVFNLKTGRLNP